MAKPNIVWIMADELRASALGCYGGSWAPVSTPNIDALAARGVLFTNNFCNSPVCVPSRMSTLTAAPPERTGVYCTCLSSKLTAAEAEYIVRDGDCRLLVAGAGVGALAEALVPLLGDVARYMVDGIVPGFDSWEDACAGFPASPIADPQPGSIMLYSSGTTGRPKGVRFPLPEEALGQTANAIVYIIDGVLLPK